MIRGMHSSFLGSRYIYYEPAWGIFRKHFQGWSQEEIEETVKRRYGEGIVLLETEPSGTRVYRAPGAGPGKEPFEFWVKNNYEMEDNYVMHWRIGQTGREGKRIFRRRREKVEGS